MRCAYEYLTFTPQGIIITSRCRIDIYIMGLCGSKKMNTMQAIRAIRRGEDGVQAIMDNIADIQPQKKNPLGMSPFLTACKSGRTKVVKAFLEGPNSTLLTNKDFSEGLWQSCSGNHLSTELCSMLMTPAKWNGRTADPNHYDRETMCTPLHLCLKKRTAWDTTQMAERAHTISLLCKSGAKFDMFNTNQKTALEMGIYSEFERGCVALIKGGSPLLQVQTYLKDHPHDKHNWVANSLLSKFAFKHPLFVKQMKEQFMQEFDPDGSGELDKGELLHFIAFHVKMGFKNGMSPVTEFDDKDGNLDIPTIKILLKNRCPDLIKKYESLDTDGGGTYSWNELVPISQDFYSKLWNKDRPETAGKDEYANPVIETELKNKYDNMIKEQIRVDTIAEKGKTQRSGKGSKYAAPVVSKTKMAKPSKDSQPLKDGWKEHKDKKTGKSYYYHAETKQTTWKRPTREEEYY